MTATATIDQFNERAKAEVSAGEVIEINAALKMLAKDQSMVMGISSSTGADYRISRILFDYFKHQIDDKGADYTDIVMVLQSACDAFRKPSMSYEEAICFNDIGMYGHLAGCFGDKFLVLFIYGTESSVVNIATIVGVSDYAQNICDEKPSMPLLH